MFSPPLGASDAGQPPSGSRTAVCPTLAYHDADASSVALGGVTVPKVNKRRYGSSHTSVIVHVNALEGTLCVQAS
jgi:hypothetical protein